MRVRYLARPLRSALCGVLSVQLALTGTAVAQSGARDLQVEELVQELKESAALWVLSIGVSDYSDQRMSLKYAHNDAIAIARMLKAQEGLLFREVFTHVLVNEGATREDILLAMGDFLGQAAGDDVILIFMAGHGLQHRQTGTYYFLPHDASAGNLVSRGLSMPAFQESCKQLQTNVSKLIFWLDTCHAGAVSMAARAGISAGEDLAMALSEAEGQYWMSASKAGEESYEDENYRLQGRDESHGAFTYSILRGLHGDAADDGGVVWISDLFTHVSKEVPRLTRGKQHPHWQLQGTNLPLFVVDESALAMAADISVSNSFQPGPLGPAPPVSKGGGKKWLWLLLAAGAAGGAAVALGGGDATSPGTGSVGISVVVP